MASHHRPLPTAALVYHPLPLYPHPGPTGLIHHRMNMTFCKGPFDQARPGTHGKTPVDGRLCGAASISGDAYLASPHREEVENPRRHKNDNTENKQPAMAPSKTYGLPNATIDTTYT